MGHLLFIILHIVAFLFGGVGLFVTIPLHLIYANSRRTLKITEKSLLPEEYAAKQKRSRVLWGVLAVVIVFGYAAGKYRELSVEGVQSVTREEGVLKKSADFEKQVKDDGVYKSQPPGHIPAPKTELRQKQAANPIGDWASQESVNPVDDSKTVVLMLEASSGESRWGDKVSLYIKCDRNTTNVYVHWFAYLGGETMVTSRIDDHPSKEKRWAISTDKKASFYPAKKITFIKRLLGADKLLVQTTPYNEAPVTAIFNVRGLSDKIGPLREACHW